MVTMNNETLNLQFLSLWRDVQHYVDKFYHPVEEKCCESPVFDEVGYCKSPVFERASSPALFRAIRTCGLPEDIKEINTDLEPTFSQKLFKYIKAKGITETECYKGANLDRRLFSKMRSNDEYQPSKLTVFALVISLKLSAEEADDLLESAGFTISHSYKLDTVMEFLIERRVYDINLVNEILYAMECPLLGAK